MNEESEKNNTAIVSIFKSTLIRNVLLTISAIALFFSGVLVYGVILKMREAPLKDAMLNKGFRKLENVNIIVDRRNYTLNVYEDTVLIKSYRASFGRNLADKKKKFDDGATPVGTYKICNVVNDKNYYKFVKISYPNLEDASEALRKSFITQKEFNQIKFEYYYEECVS